MTAVNTSDLKNKVASTALTRAQRDALPADQRIAAYLDMQKNEIARAIPKHLTPDRMARIALTTIKSNPNLLRCSVESLMGAIMQASQLGLEPGLLGHCYLIPYGTDAQLQIGYKGMIDLARRSGNIQSISAHEVYINDYFKLTYGLKEDAEHVPWHLREDKVQTEPGPVKTNIGKDNASLYLADNLKGVYAVAHFKDGGYQLHYMPKAEIEQHKLRSKTWRNGPWQTDYIEMAKKTVIRAMWKWLPISVEIARQVESADNSIKRDIAPDMADVDSIIDSVAVEEVEVVQAAEPAGEMVEPTSEEVQKLFNK
jgi:recombination protein RecT